MGSDINGMFKMGVFFVFIFVRNGDFSCFISFYTVSLIGGVFRCALNKDNLCLLLLMR